ncbi:Anamorsin [Blyttiomyces sp. JEL0837]|nr:Anamorsin [Blyttiomyces sp. JEL0837]
MSPPTATEQTFAQAGAFAGQHQNATQKASAGDKILLIGNPSATQSDMESAHSELSTLVTTSGSVSFEQFDRLDMVKLPLSNYNKVVSGSMPPYILIHSDSTLASLGSALCPGGSLHITEPVCDDVSQESSTGIRSKQSFLSALRLAGFVTCDIVNEHALDDIEFKKLMARPRLQDLKAEKVHRVTVVATKPTYEVGASAKLSFGKKKTAAAVPEPAKKEVKAPVKAKESVWVVSANDDDDDQDLEDDEALLDEEDKIAPAIAVPPECATPAAGGKKKACKDCSCGLAQELAKEELMASMDVSSEIVVVKAKKAVASSCGSCYLGDAFRCSTCPYMGMPAFKPGEKIVLSGNLLQDDI